MVVGLNELSDQDAGALLKQSCGATRWVQRMVEGRPYKDLATLREAARATWETMERQRL